MYKRCYIWYAFVDLFNYVCNIAYTIYYIYIYEVYKTIKKKTLKYACVYVSSD